MTDDRALEEVTISALNRFKAPGVSSDPFSSPVGKLSGVKRNIKRRAKNFEKRLAGVEGISSKQIEDQYTAYDALDVATPPYDMANLAKLYEVSSYNSAAVNAKAANTVGLGFEFVESFATKQVLQKTKSENKKKLIRERLDELKFLLGERLDSMNEETLFLESITHAYIDYEVTGNGYIEIGRTVDGNIGYIGTIPSQTMRVRHARDGYIQVTGARAVFFRNFGDSTTADPIGDQSQPNEIIHLKKFSPSNTYYGIPDIVSAMIAVAGNEFYGKYNLDFFEHRAAPRYIITMKGARLSPTSQQMLLDFFQGDLKGKNHRSLYIPLPPDDPMGAKVEFKMEPVEVGTQDSSFEQYKVSNRDEILMAHRVPITKIGISENASVALAKDADKTFKEQVTGPEQKKLEKRINRIIAEFTDAVVLKFNEMTLTDEDTQSRIDERYLRTQVYVPNEVRIRKGMAPREGGDEPLQLTGQAAAEQKAEASGNRARDQKREATNPDSSGSQPRNAKGEGRQQQ